MTKLTSIAAFALSSVLLAPTGINAQPQEKSKTPSDTDVLEFMAEPAFDIINTKCDNVSTMTMKDNSITLSREFACQSDATNDIINAVFKPLAQDKPGPNLLYKFLVPKNQDCTLTGSLSMEMGGPGKKPTVTAKLNCAADYVPKNYNPKGPDGDSIIIPQEFRLPEPIIGNI
jgi:hypothetical protein